MRKFVLLCLLMLGCATLIVGDTTGYKCHGEGHLARKAPEVK